MTFRIYSGEELVRTERLAQDIIKIGKLPSSHLRLDDENVSRMHAVIEVTSPEEIHIIDLGSASGTIVNGKKVNKSELKRGDVLNIGDLKIEVDVSEGGALAAAPPPKAPGAPVPPRPGKPSAPAVNPFASKGSPFAAPKAALPNPFAPPPAAAAGSAKDVDPEQITYGIVASGPPVTPEEVETPEAAVEVVVMWGDRTVLHVEHLKPPRIFTVGEPANSKDRVDFLMGADSLGVAKLPICIPSGTGVSCVIPEGATGTLVDGDVNSTFEELAQQGKLQPHPGMPGARVCEVPAGATARVQHRNFTFVVKPVKAGRRVKGGMGEMDWAPLAYIGASMLLFSLLLLLFYFSPPRPAGLALDMLDTDSRLVKFAMEAAATVEEEPEDWLEEEEDEGGKGKRHKGEEGQMGDKKAKKTNNRYAIEGPADNENPQMARESAREMARNAGVLGTLRAMTGSWNSPTSPFGAASALGNDPTSALGALMGDQIGGNFGHGGLGLTGTGRGGGGTGEGTIGLGNIGTIGHGGGGGDGSGYGRGAGGLRSRKARVPRIRSGAAEVRGSLSKEVIRRVIRRHINEVRFCYEQELNARPDLEGRVTVRFIISTTGTVQTAMVASSTLGNQRVEGCVAGAVRRWTFPAPEGGGIVIVNYPFMPQQS
ncbi:MAG: TonB family protein [Myxococcales bacterium]|nr:TonB family protein [Myxococcales bacterium]